MEQKIVRLQWLYKPWNKEGPTIMSERWRPQSTKVTHRLSPPPTFYKYIIQAFRKPCPDFKSDWERIWRLETEEQITVTIFYSPLCLSQYVIRSHLVIGELMSMYLKYPRANGIIICGEKEGNFWKPRKWASFSKLLEWYHSREI